MAPPLPPLAEKPSLVDGPPMAEVTSIPVARRSAPRAWWAAAAAAVLVVLLASALLVRSATTGETGPAVSMPAEPPTSAPVTSAPTSVPTTLAPVPVPTGPTKPSSPSTTVAPTTTARPTALTLSPDGLGPLRLGMTTKQATATGAVGPFQADELTPDGSCGSSPPAGAYRPDDFAALFLEGKLVRFYVFQGSRLRTPQGIGIGSAASKLGAVPGARSEIAHPYGRGTNVYIMTGSIGYQFTVEHGTVTEWSVGTKAGLDTPEGCA